MDTVDLFPIGPHPEQGAGWQRRESGSAEATENLSDPFMLI